jgi:hypothetical protein
MRSRVPLYVLGDWWVARREWPENRAPTITAERTRPGRQPVRYPHARRRGNRQTGRWMVFSPDSRRLAVYGGETRLRVWDLACVRDGLAERGLDW